MARKSKDNSKSEDKRPIKAYKFRIYPDAAQRAMLDRTFGCTRFVWNKLVANFNKNYDTIILEDLNIKGMAKNHKLAGAVMDASWYSLISKIQYKCGWYGKTFHQINRFFASSKTCSCCGHKMPELALSVREWECPECKTYHDRDLNAAKNILVQGFQDLYQMQPPDERSGRGGLISLMKPVQAPAALAWLMKRELNSTNLDTIVSI